MSTSSADYWAGDTLVHQQECNSNQRYPDNNLIHQTRGSSP